MFKLDNLLRKRIRRTPKMLLMMKILLSQNMCIMKKLSLLQSQLLWLLQNQLFKKFKLPQLLLPAKLIGPRPIKHKVLNQLKNHYSHHSLLVISKWLTQSQTTSDHPKKTLSRVDMLAFCASLLLNKKLCTQSMKTSNISMLFIKTLKVSDYSLKTLVSVWEKWDNSMRAF